MEIHLWTKPTIGDKEPSTLRISFAFRIRSTYLGDRGYAETFDLP